MACPGSRPQPARACRVAIAALTAITTLALTAIASAITAGPANAQEDTFFTPNITVNVPQRDRDRDGINDYAGTNIQVNYKPTASSPDGCTQAAFEIYVVDDDGMVARQAEPIKLVSVPAGSSLRCDYDVIFPSIAGNSLALRPSGAGTSPAPNPNPSAPPTQNAPGGSFEYDPLAIELALPAGWVVLAFGGATGTTPRAFAAALGNAVTSLWVWDAQSQGWLGWTARFGSLGLDRLTQGDAIMAYSPAARVVRYGLADLLEPPPAVGELSLPPGYSLLVYGGERPLSVASLFGSRAGASDGGVGAIASIFRWNAEAQNWDYNLPGRQPTSSVALAWFDTIQPGDALFVFNASDTSTTVSWPQAV